AYQVRILPGGGDLVADNSEVARLDSTGKIVQTYVPSDEAGPQLFALNLDPDGTSFWTADLVTGNVYEFNLASGALEREFNPGTGNGVAGLSVVGQITAGVPAAPAVSPSVPTVTGSTKAAFSGSVNRSEEHTSE